VVSTTPRPLYPRERPGTHCTGGFWMCIAVAKFLANEEPIRDGGQIQGRVATSTLICTLNSSFL
jgi:hypothetical protein